MDVVYCVLLFLVGWLFVVDVVVVLWFVVCCCGRLPFVVYCCCNLGVVRWLRLVVCCLSV